MTYDFVMGMDVGKYFHHACVLDPKADKPYPNASTSTKGPDPFLVDT
ncbi:hypothetical protein FRC0263_00274 [Corynebacterium diphtheriae]|nr:hypothetical protein FRC0263_00274 [Corynebacterium diphtheriae]